ncbi:MAG: glucosaminidase domain-containing protein [Candidatus Saccharimonadales bacterium]
MALWRSRSGAPPTPQETVVTPPVVDLPESAPPALSLPEQNALQNDKIEQGLFASFVGHVAPLLERGNLPLSDYAGHSNKVVRQARAALFPEVPVEGTLADIMRNQFDEAYTSGVFMTSDGRQKYGEKDAAWRAFSNEVVRRAHGIRVISELVQVATGADTVHLRRIQKDFGDASRKARGLFPPMTHDTPATDPRKVAAGIIGQDHIRASMLGHPERAAVFTTLQRELLGFPVDSADPDTRAHAYLGVVLDILADPANTRIVKQTELDRLRAAINEGGGQTDKFFARAVEMTLRKMYEDGRFEGEKLTDAMVLMRSVGIEIRVNEPPTPAAREPMSASTSNPDHDPAVASVPADKPPSRDIRINFLHKPTPRDLLKAAAVAAATTITVTGMPTKANAATPTSTTAFMPSGVGNIFIAKLPDGEVVSGPASPQTAERTPSGALKLGEMAGVSFTPQQSQTSGDPVAEGEPVELTRGQQKEAASRGEQQQRRLLPLDRFVDGTILIYQGKDPSITTLPNITATQDLLKTYARIAEDESGEITGEPRAALAFGMVLAQAPSVYANADFQKELEQILDKTFGNTPAETQYMQQKLDELTAGYRNQMQADIDNGLYTEPQADTIARLLAYSETYAHQNNMLDAFRDAQKTADPHAPSESDRQPIPNPEISSAEIESAMSDYFSTYGGSLTANQRKFLEPVIRGVLLELQKGARVNPAVVITQAAHESGWGQSGLAQRANNLFGVKAGSSWTGKTIDMDTGEVFDGRRVTVGATWRAYDTIEDAIKDYMLLIGNQSNFADAMRCADTPGTYIDGLLAQLNTNDCGILIPQGKQGAGSYATDPDYKSKILAGIQDLHIDYFNKFSPPRVEQGASRGEDRPNVPYLQGVHFPTRAEVGASPELAQSECDRLGLRYIGPADGYRNGQKETIYLCEMPEKYWYGKPRQVSVTIAARVMTLLDEMHRRGYDVSLNSDFRTMAEQIEARARNQCGGPENPPEACKVDDVARPGFSKHQSGEAVDIGVNGVLIRERGTEIQKALIEVAHAVGMEDIPSEAWHIQLPPNAA